MSLDHVPQLESPETILGQLQRGRGEGYLAAREMSDRAAATDLLWTCIAHDPRWDRQVESRSEYYAQLAVELSFDVGRLRPAELPETTASRDRWLVNSVLSRLVELGVDRASEALELHERVEWDEPVLNFPSSRPDVEASPMPEMDATAKELLAYPWKGTVPKRLIHRLTQMLRDGERQDLLDAAAQSGSVPAIRALTRLADPGLLEVADQLLTAPPTVRSRGEVIRYVESLDGELTLDLAREWIHRDEFGLAKAAQGVLSRWATPGDRPLVFGCLRIAWDERDFYSICNLLEAVEHTGLDGETSSVEEIFTTVEYSYARISAFTALCAHAPSVVSRGHLNAAFWDSQAYVREGATVFATDNEVAVGGPVPSWGE